MPDNDHPDLFDLISLGLAAPRLDIQDFVIGDDRKKDGPMLFDMLFHLLYDLGIIPEEPG